MDLRGNIQEILWESIAENYENASYSTAILDAMHLLTETIRNKSGLEGDGSALVGNAFGSNDPKIKLNKLQTDSEKNVQKGMQDLLRGLYMVIRNPRSHEKYTDNKKDADSIIHFIDYILKSINNSTTSFEPTLFFNRVFEEHYVCSEEYSNLLVQEIPQRQRANFAIEVILKRKRASNIDNVRSFLSSLFPTLEPADISRILKVVSEELTQITSDYNIQTMIHVVPAHHWHKLDKVVKLRIENILFKSMMSGRVVNGKCLAGHLATWITAEHLSQFDNFDKWMKEIMRMHTVGTDGEQFYIKEFFWKKTVKSNRYNINRHVKFYFETGLNSNSKEVIEEFKDIVEFEKDHPWWEIFKDSIKNHPEIRYDDILEGLSF
ncbi:TIGR02391 family protein [Priestia megaterium]|uniref:TIGR02391 family protein n=2 Tax=Priestia megaterium TaxID=1404 RepID=UPI000BFA2DB7|nr:TIGR02391 family protein [Priestia megaterium]PFP10145.1 TIGR02391 family protein [Priestia megaterium]